MDFSGARAKLAPTDFADAAAAIGVTEAHIRTVVEVETNGHGFDAEGHLEILFERHRFWQELSIKVPLGNGKYRYDSTPARARAAAAGLAYPVWGTKPYPKSAHGRWDELVRACAIDESAALKSASYGLGQIMGSEYVEAGYHSAQELVTAFFQGEREQVDAMCRLIKRRGLDADLRNKNWAHFALRYNGAGYRKNHYDTKLAAAYAKWSAKLAKVAAAPPPPTDAGDLKIGSRGPRVKELQANLQEAKYNVGAPDGAFGNLTRDAVVAWKMDNSVTPLDPVVTPEQFDAIAVSAPRPLAADRQDATVADLKGQSRIVDTASLIKKGAAGAGGVLGVSEAVAPEDVAPVTTVAPHVPAAVPAEAVPVDAVPVPLTADGLLEHATNLADKGQQVRGVVDQVRDVLGGIGLVDLFALVSHHKLIAIGAVLGAIFVGGHLIQRYRLQMHKDGETT